MAALDLPTLHTRALASTGEIVADMGEPDWSAPTPCDAWDLRALVNHVIAGNWWAAELGGGCTIADVGTRLDGDVIHDHAHESYEASAAAASMVFEAPGAMTAPCAVSYGPVPGSVYCGHRIVDVVIHGWDIAAATGQPTVIDPVLVAGCLEIARPQLRQLVASAMFGSYRDASGEDPERELLAMLGRA